MARRQSQLLRTLTEMGVRWKQGRKHIKVYAPGGIVVISVSPSDVRASKNAVALLRRCGVPIEKDCL